MTLLDRPKRAGLPEPLLAELPQRLEQAVAGLVGVDQLHHRLVDKVDHRRRAAPTPVAAGRTAHGLGGIEVEAAREHRQVG